MKAMRKDSLKKAQEAKMDEKAIHVKALEDRFNAELDAERKEFYDYIVIKRQSWDSDFLRGMQDKIEKRQPLSDNMKNALRKMQERDRQYEANKAMRETKKDQPIKRIGVLVKQWWANQNNLANRTFMFDVYAETAKAYMVKGTADIIDGTYCFRCGKQLTEVASQTIGFGEVCARKVGVPYPVDILNATKKERKAYRDAVRNVLKDENFSGWLPKSQVVEVLSEAKL